MRKSSSGDAASNSNGSLRRSSNGLAVVRAIGASPREARHECRARRDCVRLPEHPPQPPAEHDGLLERSVGVECELALAGRRTRRASRQGALPSATGRLTRRLAPITWTDVGAPRLHMVDERPCARGESRRNRIAETGRRAGKRKCKPRHRDPVEESSARQHASGQRRQENRCRARIRERGQAAVSALRSLRRAGRRLGKHDPDRPLLFGEPSPARGSAVHALGTAAGRGRKPTISARSKIPSPGQRMNPGSPRVLRIYHSGRDRFHRERERRLRALDIDVTLVVPASWPEGEKALSTEEFLVVELPISPGRVNHRRSGRSPSSAASDQHARDRLSAAASDLPAVLYTAQNVDEAVPAALRAARALYLPACRRALPVQLLRPRRSPGEGIRRADRGAAAPDSTMLSSHPGASRRTMTELTSSGLFGHVSCLRERGSPTQSGCLRT